MKLPAALFSRFNLTFAIHDAINRENDQKLALHILHVHTAEKQPLAASKTLSIATLRKYIRLCKRYTPIVPKNITKIIADAYVNMRRDTEYNYHYVSPRMVLSIIRLSGAMARLRFSNEVTKDDVNNVIQLILLINN